MKCSEIISQLEQLAPPCYALGWDNVGLLAGRRGKEVKKIMIALDATDEVVDEAIAVRADMLITHHPLIFKPLKQINDEDFVTRRLMLLIQNDISYYAMHTNFDCAPGGMADLASERLLLTHKTVLEATGVTSSGEAYGIGKAGFLPKAKTVRELAADIKQSFGLPFVTIYGETAVKTPVQYVAVSPGSGKSAISHALSAGAEVLITGDIGHHEGIDAAASHMAVIDAGHYGLEHLFIDFIEDYLKQQYGDELALYKAAVCFPAAML